MREDPEKTIEERRTEIPSWATDERMHFLRNGKIQIQMILWDLLPASTTLEEADEIGCRVFDEIDAFWLKKYPDIDAL